MPLAVLKKELRVIIGLIAAMQGNASFAEDLVVLERNRRALQAAITVEHARRRRSRRARRIAVPAPVVTANTNQPGQAA